MVDQLDSLEREELIRWFMSKLSLEHRRELMQRYPQHYNKMVDKDLLVVNARASVVSEGTTAFVGGVKYEAGATVPEHEI